MGEYKPRIDHDWGKERFWREYFGVSVAEFERDTGINVDGLDRHRYVLGRRKFESVARGEPGRVEEGEMEVCWHSESSTLVVPPPPTGVASVEDLPRMAVPVVGFIEQREPDIVVGCDRGARLYSLAVYGMWNRMHKRRERFPTIDNRLHFARLSTSLSLSVTSGALLRIIGDSDAEAKSRGRSVDYKRQKIMFIDDLIDSGATREQIIRSLRKIGIGSDNIFFAVMCGGGADVAGSRDKLGVKWHDNVDMIGVDYTKDGYPFPVCTDKMRLVREELFGAVRNVRLK